MKLSNVWICLLMIWKCPELDSSSLYVWKATGTAQRFVQTSATDSTSSLPSVIFCAGKCVTTPTCISFNYQASTGLCELLNKTPVPPSDNSDMDNDLTWNHYTFVFPKKTGPCPTGTVSVPYHVPIYTKYDPNVLGYVCTADDWILQEIQSGRTNCEMVLYYDTDFSGYDVTNYYGVVAPYTDAFNACVNYNCCGMVCFGHLGKCYLKKKVPEETSANPRTVAGIVFWSTICL